MHVICRPGPTLGHALSHGGRHFYTTNVLVKGVFVRLSSVLGADSYAGSPGSSLGDGTTREHACDGVRRYLETLAEGS